MRRHFAVLHSEAGLESVLTDGFVELAGANLEVTLGQTHRSSTTQLVGEFVSFRGRHNVWMLLSTRSLS